MSRVAATVPRAWVVSDREHEHSEIVIATKRSEAIMKGISQFYDTTYIEAACRRAPEFDAGVPTVEVLLRDHGWHHFCSGCDRAVTWDTVEHGDASFLDGADEAPTCTKCAAKRE